MTTLKELVTRTRQIIKELPKNADSIAVKMYKDGVRNAKCEDIYRCAVAQYIANKLDTRGATVCVCNGVEIQFKGEEVRVPLTREAKECVENFDSGEYKFLEGRTK